MSLLQELHKPYVPLEPRTCFLGRVQGVSRRTATPSSLDMPDLGGRNGYYRMVFSQPCCGHLASSPERHEHDIISVFFQLSFCQCLCLTPKALVNSISSLILIGRRRCIKKQVASPVAGLWLGEALGWGGSTAGVLLSSPGSSLPASLPSVFP